MRTFYEEAAAGAARPRANRDRPGIRIAIPGGLAAALAVGLLAGCVTAPRPAPEVDLGGAALARLDSESAPYRAGGTAAIAVRVTLETPRGRVIAGDGTPVLLLPATSFAKAAFQRDVVDGDRMPEIAEGQFLWRATTDSEGRRTFRGLAEGDYLVASPVQWHLAGEATYLRTDVAWARVSVAAGQEAEAAVSRTSTATLEQ